MKYYVSNQIGLIRRSISGLTQSKLARRVGVSKNAISDFERNVYQPSVATALSLCEELGVDFDDLFIIRTYNGRVVPHSHFFYYSPCSFKGTVFFNG